MMTKCPYKSRTLTLPLGCLLSLAAATPALAQTYTQTQTFPFNVSNSGSTLPLTIAKYGDFSAIAQPFNPALGTLVSFAAVWRIDLTASGVVDADNGNFSTSEGGDFKLAGISYSADSNSDGNVGYEDEVITLGFRISDTPEFLVSESGVSYNAGLLAAVTGAAPFTLLWDSDYRISGSDMRSVTGTAIGSVTLTYTYLPEASTSAAMGLAFVAVGSVVWRRRKAGTPEVTQAATK
jgi:hypothetical protein